VEVEFVEGILANEDSKAIVNLNDESLSCMVNICQDFMQVAGRDIENDCEFIMNERQGKPLARGSVVEAKTTGKLKSRYLLHSIQLGPETAKITKDQFSKQIQNILRKTNLLGLDSVSMPILVDEPCTPAERMVFTCALLPALRTITMSKTQSLITKVRIVIPNG